MEEDIEYLKRHIKAIGKTRSTEAIENLINKYKEQEKHIEALDSVVIEHMGKNKEQEKIIELLAEELNNYCVNDYVDCYGYTEAGIKTSTCDRNCARCIREIFEKKVRGK